MSDVFDRIILLLAGANVTRREISDIQSALRRHSAEEIFLRVTEVRQPPHRGVDGRHSERRSVKHESSWSVGERVAKLLREEAELSPAVARDLIVHALVSDGLLDLDDVPPISKKSFHDWVDRVANIVAPREILRVATEIRNGVVGDDSADWLSSPKAR